MSRGYKTEPDKTIVFLQPVRVEVSSTEGGSSLKGEIPECIEYNKDEAAVRKLLGVWVMNRFGALDLKTPFGV